MFALAAPREAHAERWGCVTEHKEQKLQKHSPNFHHFCVGFPLLGLGLPRTASCPGRSVPADASRAERAREGTGTTLSTRHGDNFPF